MNLSDLSIRRPVMAWMLMSGLVVFGAISLGKLGVSYMPDIDFPTLDIQVNWEGAAPELVEAEIIDKIEQGVIAVEGIKEMRSTIRQGAGSVSLEFDINRNVDVALQEVQTALSQIQLPLNVNPPTVRKQNPEDEPIMWIGVSSTRDFRELTEYVDLYLADQFQILPGVGEVNRAGFSGRNLRVWIDHEKLKKWQMTPLDVVQAIQREHREVAAGFIENSQYEINLRTMGEGLTPEEVGSIKIIRRGGQPIYDTSIRVRDVARVEDGLGLVRRKFIIDSKEAIGLGIRKQRKSNEVEVARVVRAKVEEISRTLPEDIKIRVNVDFTSFVVQSIYFTQKELIIASILTAIICFLFLGNWTSSLNVLLSIPTSIVGTFLVIYFMGFTLNLFTMLALTLVIGIVVDDAIMVLENITRHFHMGKNKVKAAREGSREILFAAVAASVAVMAIFLPVAFMEGIIGKFFFQFGVTLSAAVALSLVEAITLTPMRCSQFMEDGGRDPVTRWVSARADRWLDWLSAVYQKTLHQALTFRWAVVVISFVLFGLSLVAARGLRQEFVPQQDQNFFRVAVEAPVGSSLEYTKSKCLEIEKYLKSRSEVTRFVMSVGGSFSNTAMIPVVLTEKHLRAKGQEEIMREFRRDLSKIEGIKVRLNDLSSRGLTARRSLPVEFNIRGADYAKLKVASEEIVQGMKATGMMVDIDTSYREGQPELQIIPNREAAALRGVSMEDLGQTIQTAMGSVREGKFTSQGRRYDVRIQLEKNQRLQPADLEHLQIRTAYGELIPITDVVEWKEVKVQQSISRVNRQRAVTISANLVKGVSQSVALAEAQRIAEKVLPEGYTFNLEGGAQSFKESFGSLWFALLVGIVVAYMILAAQFNSFIHPITVLLALPFSVTGAFMILMAFDQSMNLFSMIGLILLFGIVKKNSILLVEFTNHVREEEKMGIRAALEKACPIRLRPILMTSCATVGAAIPTALSSAPGSEARVPMALTIMGGVIVSTFFTLYVVPCAYSLFSKLERHKHNEELEKEFSDLAKS
jgi:hydrophobe/amphiphile efflux-1 (HAE1) family protein